MADDYPKKYISEKYGTFDSDAYRKDALESAEWERDGRRRGALKCEVGKDWEFAKKLAQCGATITVHLSPGYVETLKKAGVSLNIISPNKRDLF